LGDQNKKGTSKCNVGSKSPLRRGKRHQLGRRPSEQVSVDHLGKGGATRREGGVDLSEAGKKKEGPEEKNRHVR